MPAYAFASVYVDTQMRLNYTYGIAICIFHWKIMDIFLY